MEWPGQRNRPPNWNPAFIANGVAGNAEDENSDAGDDAISQIVDGVSVSGYNAKCVVSIEPIAIAEK